MPRRAAPRDFEVHIGPHPVRPDWRVLRIAYATRPEHDARVVAALDALFGPRREDPGAADASEDAPR